MIEYIVSTSKQANNVFITCDLKVKVINSKENCLQVPPNSHKLNIEPGELTSPKRKRLEGKINSRLAETYHSTVTESGDEMPAVYTFVWP